MDMAEHVLVANGVVFVYSSGEDARQGALDQPYDAPAPQQPGALRRIAESRRAQLYALDTATGQELWNSGDTIASWNHSSGLSVANGRTYLTTFDGTVYAFGVPR